MAFKDRLKEARLQNNMTQEFIANKLGVAKSTFTGYEKGNSEPNMNTISNIMNILQVDANYLWQDEMDELGGNPMHVKYKEMEHIKKYRDLDDHGTHMVDMVLQNEWERVDKYGQISDEPAARIINYYEKLASAGTGQVIFEDIPTSPITIPAKDEYRRVGYAIGVNGDSMEPLYNDGDVLLIEPTNSVDVGEIGIFLVDGEAYVKKLGNGELISLNKDRDNIPLTSHSNCMGRVVGKL